MAFSPEYAKTYADKSNDYSSTNKARDMWAVGITIYDFLVDNVRVDLLEDNARNTGVKGAAYTLERLDFGLQEGEAPCSQTVKNNIYDLLERMLTVDPKQRIKGEELLTEANRVFDPSELESVDV